MRLHHDFFNLVKTYSFLYVFFMLLLLYSIIKDSAMTCRALITVLFQCERQFKHLLHQTPFPRSSTDLMTTNGNWVHREEKISSSNR
jgi:predicted DNA-binding helix-hairpin-helix protein